MTVAARDDRRDRAFDLDEGLPRGPGNNPGRGRVTFTTLRVAAGIDPQDVPARHQIEVQAVGVAPLRRSDDPDGAAGSPVNQLCRALDPFRRHDLS
jgi:hypothetical protein